MMRRAAARAALGRREAGLRRAQRASALAARDSESASVPADPFQGGNADVGSTHRKAKKQARLANTGITDQHEDKKVIV